MLQLVVRPVAEADLEAAFTWYEAQSPSLGLDFLRAVDACFDAIATRPLVYPVVHRGLRRASLRRFPCGVYFHVDDTTVRVVACIHCEPPREYWRLHSVGDWSHAYIETATAVQS